MKLLTLGPAEHYEKKWYIEIHTHIQLNTHAYSYQMHTYNLLMHSELDKTEVNDCSLVDDRLLFLKHN